MVQKLLEGRKKIKRVESQAVEDVFLIARNALDRISELKRRPMSAYKEYEVREMLRKTKDRLNAHQNLAAALMVTDRREKMKTKMTMDELSNMIRMANTITFGKDMHRATPEAIQKELLACINEWLRGDDEPTRLKREMLKEKNI